MELFCLITFLGLYYLRPQEWFATFNSLHPIQLLSVMAIYAMFQKQRFRWREMVQTPVDWLMICYFVWTLIVGFQPLHTFSNIEAAILFYFVAASCLNTIDRQTKFLGWWCGFMIVIALLAILGGYGLFDPLGSQDLTEGVEKGRLSLNLSIFNNPNALAHSMVPAVPLIYYLLYWKRIVAKPALLLMAIPLWCIFMTESKGAFLCGFATLLTTLTFGRSKAMQGVIVLFAVLGYGALYSLPRMNDLHRSKSDPAVQGRVEAAAYGLQLMQTTKIGIGLGNFQDSFTRYGPMEKTLKVRIVPAHAVPNGDGTPHRVGAQRLVTYKYEHFVKATHSAYNQNGAELGYPGLFLFVGILYCCIRTLLLAKGCTEEEERIRRMLFAMVVAYAVSSWMVDFCYRPTFFMMVATVSAFHRYLLRKSATATAAAPEPEKPRIKPWIPQIPPLPGMPGLALGAGPGASPLAPVPAGLAVAATATPGPRALVLAPAPAGAMTAAPPPDSAWGRRAGAIAKQKEETKLRERLAKQFAWTRLGVLDFVLILAATYGVILYWEHLIATM